MFDAIVVPTTVTELISAGFLVPYEMHSAPHPLRNDEIAVSPVKAYQKYADSGKAIIFAPHVKAGNSFLEEFNTAGIPAGEIYACTDKGTRRSTLEAYASGKLRALINVGVATEGYDDPSTECIILARAVGPVGLFLQMLGRGLRRAPGKTKLVIADLHGSSHIHGTPEHDAEGNERKWSLEGEALKCKAVQKQKFCAICGILILDGGICDLCAVLRPDLVPPTVVNVQLVKYASKLREGPNKRAEYLARLMQTGREKGYAAGAASHKFKAIYGQWPPSNVQAEALGLLTKWSQPSKVENV